jgi:hypothetical protein
MRATAIVLALFAGLGYAAASAQGGPSPALLEAVLELSLDTLEPLPRDASNR